MTLFHIFILTLFLLNLYLFLIRQSVYHYVNDNWETEQVLKFYDREDFTVLAALGFAGTLWAVTTADLYFKFLY